MTKPYDQKAAFEVAEFKALHTGSGEFEALVSVFGNIDHGGDRVIKGAFAKSLGKWEAKGDPIPVIWNHMCCGWSQRIGGLIVSSTFRRPQTGQSPTVCSCSFMRCVPLCSRGIPRRSSSGHGSWGRPRCRRCRRRSAFGRSRGCRSGGRTRSGGEPSWG
jgi:hypothetical protein